MKLNYSDYKVGWICASVTDALIAREMFFGTHEKLTPINSNFGHDFGDIAGHNVVIVSGPYRGSPFSVAEAAKYMSSAFPSLEFSILVGIGGSMNRQEVRLGDVVVSESIEAAYGGGMVQCNYSKNITEETGRLDRPPQILRNALHVIKRPRFNHAIQALELPSDLRRFELISHLPSRVQRPHGADDFFPSDDENDSKVTSDNSGEPGLALCSKRDSDEPFIHYGLIASSEKDSEANWHLPQFIEEALCLEHEAFGLMDKFPCIVIRGITSYGGLYTSLKWERYAMAVAAACAKMILFHVPPIGPGLSPNAEIPLYSLCYAPWKGNPALLAKLLDYGANIEEKDVEGCTPLHLTAGYGYLGATKLLLDRGANVNAKNKLSETPLHRATQRCGHAAIVNLLLDRRADIEARTFNGATPLCAAAWWGTLKAAETLLDRNAKIEAKDNNGLTSLHRAAYNGKPELVRLLRHRDADEKAKDNKGRIPFQFSNGNQEVIKAFEEKRISQLQIRELEIQAMKRAKDHFYQTYIQV